MIRAACLALLLLAGCDSVPHSWTRAEIRDIAEDQADAARPDVGALEYRITQLEGDVRQLKADNAQQAKWLGDLTDDATADRRGNSKFADQVIENLHWIKEHGAYH